MHVTDPYAPQNPVTLINNIFYGNRAKQGNSVACTQYGHAATSYCVAWPGDQTYNYYADPQTSSSYGPGSRLLYLEPVFGNPGAGEFWLAANTSLRLDTNRGQSNVANPSVPVDDIFGNTRPTPRDQILSSYTDMGAFESIHYTQ